MSVKVSREALEKCVRFFNDAMKLDPPIQISWPESLIIRSLKLVAMMLLPQDNVPSDVMAVLLKIGANIPKDIRAIVTDRSDFSTEKVSSSEEKKDTVLCNHSCAKASERHTTVAEKLLEFVQSGLYTREELVEKLSQVFPEKSVSTIRTVISDCMNPKYTKFKRERIILYLERVERDGVSVEVVKWKHY